MRHGRLYLLAFLCFLLVFPAESAEWGPWEAPVSQQASPQSQAINSSLQQSIKLFQQYISPVDGPRCSMYPTCSAYSLQALQSHGFFLGVLQTVDRLYREGDPRERQQEIIKHGYVRFFDPLSNNDFWLLK